MKLAVFSVLAFALSVLAAQVPLKAIIVSYPSDCPASVIDQAMAAIKEAGGKITHEYKLIKGFAATAPAKVLESVSAWGAEHGVTVEEDQMVSVA